LTKAGRGDIKVRGHSNEEVKMPAKPPAGNKEIGVLSPDELDHEIIVAQARVDAALDCHDRDHELRWQGRLDRLIARRYRLLA
jgi:hypothetical protein